VFFRSGTTAATQLEVRIKDVEGEIKETRKSLKRKDLLPKDEQFYRAYLLSLIPIYEKAFVEHDRALDEEALDRAKLQGKHEYNGVIICSYLVLFVVFA